MSSIDGRLIIKVPQKVYQQACQTFSDQEVLAGFEFSNISAVNPFIAADCSAGTITGDVDELIFQLGELGRCIA